MGKATRDAYGETLKRLGSTHPDIVVLDADLSESTKTSIFAKKFPDRFFDTGIAEENMIGIAAGLATTGKIPFASTFAVFGAGRAYEQIRNSICYPNLNVKIAVTHAGLTVGEDWRYTPDVRRYSADACIAQYDSYSSGRCRRNRSGCKMGSGL